MATIQEALKKSDRVRRKGWVGWNYIVYVEETGCYQDNYGGDFTTCPSSVLATDWEPYFEPTITKRVTEDYRTVIEDDDYKDMVDEKSLLPIARWRSCNDDPPKDKGSYYCVCQYGEQRSVFYYSTLACIWESSNIPAVIDATGWYWLDGVPELQTD